MEELSFSQQRKREVEVTYFAEPLQKIPYRSCSDTSSKEKILIFWQISK